MNEVKLMEPKFEMDAFKLTIARTEKLRLLDGSIISLFYDKDGKGIAMGMGEGPHFMQFFAFEYIREQLDFKAAKESAEAEEIRLREEAAAAKLREREAAQAAKDARRLEMKALHAKPE
jgi:hypothetical protein